MSISPAAFPPGTAPPAASALGEGIPCFHVLLDLQVRKENGQLGTVVATEGGLLRVDLDSGKAVAFRPSTYRNVDHGYAATIHKSQGVTVDRAFVLATPSFDQHLSYVALSRHRDQVTLYAGKSDFPTFDKLADTMGRSGAKTATLDFENEADYQKAARLFGARRGIDGLADIAPAFQQFIQFFAYDLRPPAYGQTRRRCILLLRLQSILDEVSQII